MGEQVRARRTLIVLVVLTILAAGCSADGRRSATVRAADAIGSKAPVASSGCSAPAPVTVTELEQKITVDAVVRSYLLTTPPTHHGDPLPVVLDFHGLSESDTLEAITTQFSAEALANGFIVVFPQGTGSPAGWDIEPGTEAHANHDIEFVNAMLDKLETTLCVDRSRIYATGLSDGALFDSLLACTMSNRIAAVAPVAGVAMPTPCRPSRPVPILAFHGTADPILPFNGGVVGTTPPPINLHGNGYPANVQAWAMKDGCNSDSSDAQVAPHVILRAYRCPPGVSVEFYIVLGGGHAWPGSQFSALSGPSTFEINATKLIWNFFRRQRILKA